MIPFNNYKIINLFSNSNIILNLKNSLLFLGASVVQLFVGIFTFPIFARYLSSLDFSIIGYFDSLNQFFMPLMTLSFYNYYMMNYHNNSKEKNKYVLMNLILFLTVTNLVLIFISIVFLYFYFKITQVTFPLFPYGLFILFSAYFLIYKSFLLINYKMEKKALPYFIVSASVVVFTVFLGLIFVTKFNWGAKGKLCAPLITNFIFAIISFKILFTKFKFDFNIIKNAIKICYPLIFTAMLNFPMNYIDKLFLEKQNDVVNFGLYVVGSRIAMFLFTIGSALYIAFEPDIFKYAGQRNKRKLIITIFSVFSIFFVITLIFGLFSKYFMGLLTSGRYNSAYRYTNLFIISNFFMLFSYSLGVVLISLKKTKLILINKIFISTISIIIFIVFIGRWNFYGAAYAKIIINILICVSFFLLIYFRNSKFLKFKCNRI